MSIMTLLFIERGAGECYSVVEVRLAGFEIRGTLAFWLDCRFVEGTFGGLRKFTFEDSGEVVRFAVVLDFDY